MEVQYVRSVNRSLSRFGPYFRNASDCDCRAPAAVTYITFHDTAHSDDDHMNKGTFTPCQIRPIGGYQLASQGAYSNFGIPVQTLSVRRLITRTRTDRKLDSEENGSRISSEVDVESSTIDTNSESDIEVERAEEEIRSGLRNFTGFGHITVTTVTVVTED
ncbi:hypothetical protein K474DRAFT_720805 [Panus rudis PR-1116 ss-1]|nr:hypothetical protein K474DRAFT_720805 [Panus rudis PR-1116 ss-1]